MKRKLVSNDQNTKALATPSKRRRANRTDHVASQEDSDDIIAVSPTSIASTQKAKNTPTSRSAQAKPSPAARGARYEDEAGSPTPRANRHEPDVTPSKRGKTKANGALTPSARKKANRSAKRKSIRTLLQNEAEDDWAEESVVAQKILDSGNDGSEEEGDDALELETGIQDNLEDPRSRSQTETPSKRGRGRPKGSKNRRTPTPEGDIAPEERYFFQNRSGPPQVSNNSLSSLKLLTHEEYYDLIHAYRDPHEDDKAYLFNLHKRSFPQWRFELAESFSICLYGYGSKRNIVTSFAEHISTTRRPSPKIIVVNGYTPKLNIRTVLFTLASVVMGSDTPARLGAQPTETLSTILSYLSNSPPKEPIILLINSLDAPALRRPPAISNLARLVSSPYIHLLATADTPNFPLAWDSTIRSQFNFIFHDCTTFTPYAAELNVVDDAHDLLGRKGRRLGGREGIAFVLKSLPENARNLYRVLVSETLTALAEGIEAGDQGDEDPGPTKQDATEGEAGIEYKMLYQKAVSEFICSSEMAFRTLLKEFQDHQMVVMRSGSGRGGGEVLGVPLGREEMEGVLEDLMMEA